MKRNRTQVSKRDDDMRRGYPSVTTLLGTLMREHSLAVALAGLAAGAAVAAAFPATTLGRRVFRPAEQRLSEAEEIRR